MKVALVDLTLDNVHRRNGQKVVVRLGVTPRQVRHVANEARALETLHSLQGSDVPRLLAHGYTTDGYAFVMTEYIEVSPAVATSVLSPPCLRLTFLSGLLLSGQPEVQPVCKSPCALLSFYKSRHKGACSPAQERASPVLCIAPWQKPICAAGAEGTL